MNPDWTEGQLEFDFSSATTVERPDKFENQLKTVDFVVSFPQEFWLIECKDPEGAKMNAASEAQGLLKELRNDVLFKQHLLPKLYGTYVYLAIADRLPQGQVRYGVVIGLAALDTGLCIALADRLQRIINPVGPKRRYSRFVPLIEITTVERWNRRYPNKAIQRHP